MVEEVASFFIIKESWVGCLARYSHPMSAKASGFQPLVGRMTSSGSSMEGESVIGVSFKTAFEGQ